jgi:phosphoglycerate dehydrogenase-like enzyme
MRGIRITTAAGANAVPLAEFTIAMMLSLLKQVPWIAPA